MPFLRVWFDAYREGRNYKLTALELFPKASRCLVKVYIEGFINIKGDWDITVSLSSWRIGCVEKGHVCWEKIESKKAFLGTTIFGSLE